jgi:putative ABC transport system permease protein
MLTQLISSIEMAFQSLVSNKMRALLTMLGIIIGVGSVITLTAIGSGAAKAVSDRINSMGTNMLQIDPSATNVGGISSGAGGNIRLTEKDADALRQSPLFKEVAPWVDARGQVVAGNLNWATRMGGSTPNILSIRNYSLASGANFTDEDAKTGKKICIIGKTIVKNLFPDGSDPIGKTIRIKSIPFTVIGVLNEKGSNSYGQDQDDIILAPLATIQKRIQGITWLNDIYLSVVNEKATDAAISEATRILRQQHKLLPTDDNDFRIRSQVEMAQTAQHSTDTLSNLLSAAAAIALIVGGIGIMNIMLVSVTERTREIGIRKSIGAKSFNILFQFLTEALTLSLIGGIIGVFLGYFASYIVSNQNGWTLIISPGAVILSFAAATLVGLFFGWYPARKAARLNPIDALRQD